MYWKSFHHRFCEIPKLCFYCEALEVNEQHLTTDSSIHQVAVNKIKKITLHNLSRFNSDLSLTFPDMGTLTLCFADVDFMWVSLFVTEMGAPISLLVLSDMEGGTIA